jgi:hypothetical protein
MDWLQSAERPRHPDSARAYRRNLIPRRNGRACGTDEPVPVVVTDRCRGGLVPYTTERSRVRDLTGSVAIVTGSSDEIAL